MRAKLIESIRHALGSRAHLFSVFGNIVIFLLTAGIENRSHATAKPADDGTGRLLGSERSGEGAVIKIPHYDSRHLTDCTYHMHNTSKNSYSIH